MALGKLLIPGALAASPAPWWEGSPRLPCRWESLKPNAPPETSRTGGGLGCATTKPSLLGRPTSAREAARQLGRSGNRRQRAHPHQALCKFSRAWLAVGAGILPLQDSTGSPEMLGDQERCIRELRETSRQLVCFATMSAPVPAAGRAQSGRGEGTLSREGDSLGTLHQCWHQP